MLSNPLVEKTHSALIYLKMLNRAMHNGDQAFYRLPDTDPMAAQYYLLFSMTDSAGCIEQLVNYDYSSLKVIIRNKSFNARDILMLTKQIERYGNELFAGTGISVKVTGSNYLAARMARLLIVGLLRSIIIMLAIIFVIFILYCRSAAVALIAMIPNVLPITICLAIMGFLGIDLNITTVFLFSISIGIAVDDTFHLLYHYRLFLEQETHQQSKRAVLNMITVKAKPVIATSLAISIGFLFLALSNFTPIILFGIFIAITIFFCLIGDMVILPAFLAIRR